MKRKNEPIRKLLLDIEMAEKVIGHSHQVEGFSQQEVSYHLYLLIEQKLASGSHIFSIGNENPSIPAKVMVTRLTPEGHDFIGSIRDESVWKNVKAKIQKVGGSIALETLKAVSIAEAKRHLGLS